MSTLLRRTAPTVGDMYAVVFGVKEGVNDGCCAPVVPRYRVRHMCATSHVVSVLSRRTSNLGAVVARRIGPLASGRANVGHLRVTGNGWRAMRVSGLVRWWRKLPGGLLWRACDGRVPNIDSSVGCRIRGYCAASAHLPASFRTQRRTQTRPQLKNGR